MARKAKIVKQEIPHRLKYSVRHRNRCKLCGRPRGYIRYFELCRLCFRNLAHKGELPGVKKASW